MRLVCFLLAAAPALAAAPVQDVLVPAADPGCPLLQDRPGFRVWDAEPGRIRASATAACLQQLRAAGIVFVPIAPPPAAGRGLDGYLDYEDILAMAEQWAADYPRYCRIEQIGRSVQGRPLIDIVVTDNPGAREFEPAVKFVGNMHGDEPVSGDLCVRLVRYLLTHADSNPAVRTLVTDTELHVLPVMNPDGYSAAPRTRWNAAGVDLNRDFPSVEDPVNTTDGRAPETAAVMRWTEVHRFCASISFHSGSLGAVYPWGHAANLGPDEVNPETPLFRTLCLTYAAGNPDMWVRNDGGWEHGVRNAADWYTVLGEMADWNYRWYGVLEITVELSYEKAPYNPGFEQPWSLWDDNRESMLDFLRMVHGGVRGWVVNEQGKPLPALLAPGRMPVPDARGNDPPVRAVCLLHLDAGWNLISLPLTPDHPAPARTFKDPWCVCWQWTGSGYARVQAIEPYRPFWVYARTECDLTIHGVAASDAGPVHLEPGWNLVGPKGNVRFPEAAAGGTAIQAFFWDGKRYAALPPGSQLDITTAVWVYAEQETDLDLAPGENRPFPSRNEDDTGAYFRVLLPGRHNIWFRDQTQPVIRHVPPDVVRANVPFDLCATATAPALPLQVFNVSTPEWTDPAAPAPHAQFTAILSPASAVCVVYLSTDDGETWSEHTMERIPDESFVHHIPGLPAGTVVRYWFALFLNGDDEPAAMLGDAREPFVLVVSTPRDSSAHASPSSPETFSMQPLQTSADGRADWETWSARILQRSR